MRMMSCRKGIGWEGGAMEAREDSRQAEPRSERKGRVWGGEGAGLWQSCIAPQSCNYSFHKMSFTERLQTKTQTAS